MNGQVDEMIGAMERDESDERLRQGAQPQHVRFLASTTLAAFLGASLTIAADFLWVVAAAALDIF